MPGKALTRWLAACSVVCFAAGCSRQPPAQDERPRPVKTFVVPALDQADVRVLPGRVEASRSVALAFQVPGLLATWECQKFCV